MTLKEALKEQGDFSISLEIEHEDGNTTELKVPFDVAAMTWSAVCDFQNASDRLIDAWQDNDEEEIVESLYDACNELVPGSENLPYQINDPMPDWLENSKIIEIGDEITIGLLYCHLNSIINSYEPDIKEYKTYEFKHKDQTFCIPSLRVFNLYMQHHITAGEYLETLEYQRQLSKVQENKKEPSGNTAFRMNLIMLAILARKEGEDLPYKKNEREQFIMDRAKFFQDIEADKVLNIAFFFRNITPEYVLKNLTNTSGNPNQNPLRVAYSQKIKYDKKGKPENTAK